MIKNTPSLCEPTSEEQKILKKIQNETEKKNLDNISRTKAYFELYLKQQDMIWSLLASMVSRNAGWNMCDLESSYFQKMLTEKKRHRLYLTYERANWTIFRDAYPQLLLYYYSTKMKRPMFHLLPYFDISVFMQNEWTEFWNFKNKKRLMIALIINEQNVIQRPVIEHPFYKRKIFNTMMFNFQDLFHFNSVLFPTCHGELYGASVNGFKTLNKRIDLGKRLADILFNEKYYKQIFEFALKTEHTGSRYDYEQYFHSPKERDTPFLRMVYPVIAHDYHKQKDWFTISKFNNKWFSNKVVHQHTTNLTSWYLHKRKQLYTLSSITD